MNNIGFSLYIFIALIFYAEQALANSGVLVYGFNNNCSASNLYTFVSAPITKTCAQASLSSSCAAQQGTYVQYACSDSASPLIPKQSVLPDDFLMISIYKDDKCSQDSQYRIGYMLNSCKWYTNRYMNFKQANDNTVAYISCSDSACSKCSSAGYIKINSNPVSACDTNNKAVTGNSNFGFMGASIYASTSKKASSQSTTSGSSDTTASVSNNSSSATNSSTNESSSSESTGTSANSPTSVNNEGVTPQSSPGSGQIKAEASVLTLAVAAILCVAGNMLM